MNASNLQTTLTTLLQSGTQTNPALNALLSDYARYHLVLVVVGGIFTLAFVALGIFCWMKYRTAKQASGGKRTFEKTTFASLGVLSILIGLLMGLIVAANISNVVEHRQGLLGTVDMIGTPHPGTPRAELYQSFTTWLQSGDAKMPEVIQKSIDERLAWQLPKAIISTILLAIFAVASVYIWRNLIKRSKDQGAIRRKTTILWLGLGCLTVTSCLLLVLMVIGNTQAVLAPLALTMLFG